MVLKRFGNLLPGSNRRKGIKKTIDNLNTNLIGAVLVIQLVIMVFLSWINWRILKITLSLLNINNKILNISTQLLTVNEALLHVSKGIAISAEGTEDKLTVVQQILPKKFREVEDKGGSRQDSDSYR